MEDQLSVEANAKVNVIIPFDLSTAILEFLTDQKFKFVAHLVPPLARAYKESEERGLREFVAKQQHDALEAHQETLELQKRKALAAQLSAAQKKGPETIEELVGIKPVGPAERALEAQQTDRVLAARRAQQDEKAAPDTDRTRAELKAVIEGRALPSTPRPMIVRSEKKANEPG